MDELEPKPRRKVKRLLRDVSLPVERPDSADEPLSPGPPGDQTRPLRLMGEWLVAFWKIIYRPSPQTFLDVAQHAKGKVSSCIAWLVFIAVLGRLFDYAFFFPKDDVGRWLLVTLVSVIAVPLEVLFYVFWMRFFHRRVFHAEIDYYNELLYAVVAIYVVIAFLSRLLMLIPFLLVASTWVAYAYLVVLSVVAVMAITKLSLWKTIVTVLLSFLLTAGMVLCVGMFIVFGVLNPNPAAWR